ncbi:myosin-11 isoform X3 [Drosophila innubila]|nr:myosin-11 isoform X3 [Drosophila innubila]
MVDVALVSESDVAKLNAIIASLEQQNGELRSSLEELDAQHELAMQDVLSHKTQLQTQLTELKNLQADHLVEHELAMARLQAQLVEERERQRSAAQAQLELEQRVAEQDKELQRSVLELAEMQQLLDKRGADNGELIERVRQADGEREKLQRELDELAKLAKEKKTSESSNSSSTGKHSEDEFIVVRNADAAGSSSDPDPDPDADVDATTPPSKEKLRDKLVSLEAHIAELKADNLKLQDGELERQLSGSVLNEQLSELEKRLRISESEKEQLQLELQRKLQQLMLQNQELKLSAEADQETHANDLEQQLGALRAENSQLRQDLDASIAQAKFRQAIAEEKQEITDLDLDVDDPADNDPHKLRSLLEALLADNSEQSLERTHRLLNERWQRLDSTEQRLVDLQDQQLIADHEKKTLEADISQYILQCDELMKNNELLLNELDKFKRNKLETIEEHHEETIAQLESQLEEAQSQLQRQQQQLQQSTTAGENKEQLQHMEQLRAELKYKELKLLESTEHSLQLMTQLEELKEQLEQLEQMPEKNSQLAEQLEKLKAAKAAQEEQLHQVTDQLQFKAQQLEEIDVQLTEQAKQMKQIYLELEEKTKQLQESTQNGEKLNSQLEQLKAQLKQARESVEQSNQVEQLTQQLEQLQAELEQSRELHSQLESKQRELQDSKEFNKQLNLELEQLQAQLENPEHSRQLEQLQQQLEQKEQQLLELEEKQLQSEQLKLQLEELKEQLQQATKSAEQSTQMELLSKEEQLEQLKEALTQLQQTLDTLTNEKLELIKALQQKHAENTQYYAEIQRLQPLEQQLAEQHKEREKLCDQINFLKEKSDILTTNLLTEQTNQRLLQQQQVESQEQQVNVQRDLERLRAHLLEIEELHTQESVELQRELDESRAKQTALQQEVSKSSTAYTSASIRANQQAETLQAQHGLLLQQRDELLAKLGQYEDRELKQQAALTNLQCALEQFQNDKQHDIETAKQRMRRELQVQLEEQMSLQLEMAAMQQQLADANQGLRAAARLSDQLEAGQQTIAVLRDEVDSLKDANLKLEKSLNSSESSQTDKIDKSLIKSLLIGYVVSGHAGDKQQVLRMISSVLDFNAQESEKVGLNKPQNSWLGNILGGSSGGSSSQSSGNENLLQAFVQFLEQESQPQSSAQSRPALLSMAKQVEAAPATGATGATPGATAVATAAAAGGAAGAATGSNMQQTALHATAATPPTPPMQSLLMSSNEFAPTRNSSSILKDILNDS